MNPTRAAAAIYRERIEASGISIADPRRSLSPKQRQVWDCTERVIKLLCGRQSGKTYWACVWLLHGALSTPGSLSIYLALTQKSARNIAWGDLVSIGASVFGLPAACFVEATLTVKLPNGARILVAGTDDRRTIESWRGTKLYRAVIDEMGSQMPDLIAYFVESILWPALVKMDGRLALLGTPGLVCDGYWWEQTQPSVLEADAGGFRWDIYDNPAIPHAGAFIEETLERFRWTRDRAEFRREWLAEWVVDYGALVYPFDLERNGLDALPTISSTGYPIPASAWRHVVGGDVGVVDECAWVVWAWCPAYDGVIAVHSEIEQMDPDPAAIRTQEIIARYPGCDFVLDTGGMGKAHERIYRTKYAIAAMPAEKLGKASAIRELRGDLLSGWAKVLNTPALNALRSQWAVLGWDKKKLVHSDTQPDHVADSGLYSYRRVRHYTHAPDRHKPRPNTGSNEAWLEAQEKQMEKLARAARRESARSTGRLDR